MPEGAGFWLRQRPWHLQKCCRTLRAGSLRDDSVFFSSKVSVARYPLGDPPLGNPLPPNTFQNLRWYDFNSSSMWILANGKDYLGKGPWPLQIECVALRPCSRGPCRGFDSEERAGGLKVLLSLLRQDAWLLQNCCRALRAGSLMDESARYPLGSPLLGNPLLHFAFQNVGVRWHIRCYVFNSTSMRILANGVDSLGRGPQPLQIECVATTQFHSRGLH